MTSVRARVPPARAPHPSSPHLPLPSPRDKSRSVPEQAAAHAAARCGGGRRAARRGPASAARLSRRPSARRPRSTASQETVSTFRRLVVAHLVRRRRRLAPELAALRPLRRRRRSSAVRLGQGGHGPNSSTDSMSDDGGAPAALGGADKCRRVRQLVRDGERPQRREPDVGARADRPFASAPMGHAAGVDTRTAARRVPKAAPPAAPAPAFPLESVVVPEDHVGRVGVADVRPRRPSTPKEKETSARKPIVPFPEKGRTRRRPPPRRRRPHRRRCHARRASATSTCSTRSPPTSGVAEVRQCLSRPRQDPPPRSTSPDDDIT